jgi:hypothetical protein
MLNRYENVKRAMKETQRKYQSKRIAPNAPKEAKSMPAKQRSVIVKWPQELSMAEPLYSFLVYEAIYPTNLTIRYSAYYISFYYFSLIRHFLQEFAQ